MYHHVLSAKAHSMPASPYREASRALAVMAEISWFMQWETNSGSYTLVHRPAGSKPRSGRQSDSALLLVSQKLITLCLCQRAHQTPATRRRAPKSRAAQSRSAHERTPPAHTSQGAPRRLLPGPCPGHQRPGSRVPLMPEHQPPHACLEQQLACSNWHAHTWPSHIICGTCT